MLNIDTTTMLIELTRGDTASIVFSAVDKDGNLWNPSATTDKLKFAVAKKVGAEPLFDVVRTYNGVEAYKEVSINEDTFDAHKTWYYTESGGEYEQCTSADAYDENETYYMRDCDSFWTITIGANNEWYEKDDEGQVADPPVDLFKFKDYVWDLQLITSSGVDTIIGETSDIHPTFRVLGEVATE